MCRCLFSVPLLSTRSLTLRMAELVCPLLTMLTIGQAGQQPQGGTAARSEELGVPGTVQRLPPTMYAKPRGNLQRPRAQVRTPVWGDAVRDIPKSAPQISCSHSNVPHKYMATALSALSAKPRGMISFKREMHLTGFYSWVPLCLTPSLRSSGNLWALVACHTPTFCEHVCGCMLLTPGVCGRWHGHELRGCKSAEAWQCSFC